MEIEQHMICAGLSTLLARRGSTTTRWITCLFVLLFCSVAAGRDVSFTVRDAIGMTYLADPSPYMTGRTVQTVHWSPDRTHFVVVTRRGNLELNCNDYRLLVFDVASVRAATRSKTLAPSTEVARFCSPTNRPGIFRPKWLPGGRAVAFLWEDATRPAQVYKVDIGSSAA
jgi:hypothetical protein